MKELFWDDVDHGMAKKIVEWFEKPAFTELIAPLLAGDEKVLMDSLVTSEDSSYDGVLKGQIRGLRALVAMHDRALDIAEDSVEG